jgi:1,2-diacylglycerol 3-alpha-glucosyltransferase
MYNQNVEDDSSAMQIKEGSNSVTPKNTLLAMDSFFPAFDGVAICLDNYAKYLQKCGETHVLTSRYRHYDDSVHPYNIVRLPATRLPNSQYKMIWKIFSQKKIKQLAGKKFDIVHVHSPFIAGDIALSIARKQRIPVVGTFHSSFHIDIKRLAKFDFITRIFLRRIVRFFNNCDAVWAVNNNSANQLRAYGFKGEIRPMYNGTDLSYPVQAGEFKDEITRRYSLEKDEFIFCFCGRLIWYKGLKHCFEALAILKAEGVRFRFFVIGYGEDEKAMKEMTINLGIAENVIFTGKVSSREELTKYYTRSDLFLLLSTFDSDALTTKEAAACKTPGLLIRGSKTAEQIEDNLNGFLVEDDPAKVYLRIKQIMADPELLRNIGENAHSTLCVPWEEVVDNASRIYDEIIAKKKLQLAEKELSEKKPAFWFKLLNTMSLL